MIRISVLSAGLALATLFSAPAGAETRSETGHFDIYFIGIKAGELRYGMTRNDSAYAASGLVRASGLLAALADFKFEAESRGRISGGRFRPQSYDQQSRDDGKDYKTRIRYPGGVPRPKLSETARDYWVDPRSQRDALDPMTAAWHVLRDRDKSELCKMDVSYFDGARRARLIMSDPRRDGETVHCTGQYIRIGGYSDKELRKGRKFTLRVSYEPKPGGRYRLARMDAKTPRGRALLIRR